MGGVVRRYIGILTIIINFPYSTCISLRLQLIAGTNINIFALRVLAYTNFSDLCLHNVIKISVCTILYDDDT